MDEAKTCSDIKFYFYDSSDESYLEDSHSGNNNDNRQLIQDENKKNDSDDSPLHSLESESHGLTIQRYISKYMDHGFDESLMRETKKRKEKDNIGRSLKAAMQQTLNQRIFSNREHSQSANNLPILLSSTSPSNSSCSSPIFLESNSPQLFFHSSTKVSDAVDKLEIRRKKHWNKKRSIERDRKTDCVNYEPLTPSPVEVEKLFVQDENELKVSASMRESCLNRRSIDGSECPLERIQFYKTFSLLIRMGNKEKQSGTESEYKAENEDQLSFQAIKDFLWLELKAWHNCSSVCDEKRTIYIQRQSVPEVLKEILTFTIIDLSKNVTSDSGYVSCRNNAIDQFLFIKDQNIMNKKLTSINDDLIALKNSNTILGSDETLHENKVNDKEIKTIQSLVKSLEKSHKDLFIAEYNSDVDNYVKENNVCSNAFLDNMCACNETLSRLCQNCINKESDALHQVTKILEKLDEVEHYYSCSKALGNEYPIYNSEEFNVRVKTLNLWLNLTKGLRRKIDSLAKLFGIREKLKVGWPCYDLNEIQSAPVEEGNQEEGNESKCTLKVNFQNLSEFSNSPNTSGSDKGCCSISASPDVQNINPFDISINNANQGLQLSSTYSDYFKNFKGTRIYHRYVDKTLRHKGLKYIYSQLTSVLHPILFCVHAALKRPKPTSYAAAVAKVVTDSPSSTAKFSDTFLSSPNKEYCKELSTYGVWSESYQKMRLPTFHRPFLFLLRIPLDIVHECLQLRIQQQPEDPSSLSIGQLIKECKEVLRAGIQMRQRYINLAQTVFGEDGSDVIEAQLDSFDEDLKTMLQIYLKYLEKRKVMTEGLPPVTVHQKSSLEEEWAFVRATCPHIPGGEALAANKFCFLASDLLLCIGFHIDSGITESLNALNSSISKEQINSSSCRKEILRICRMFKSVFNDAGDKARQAVAFAKTLRKDLEIAAEFKILVPLSSLFQKLKDTGHIRVISPHNSNYIMFVPGHLQNNETYIWQLVDMTCGHENTDLNQDQDIYLIMMRYEACDSALNIWQGPTILLEPTAEATITLSQIEVDGLLLVVNHSSQLMCQCCKFQRVMSNTLQIEKQQTSCNHAIAEALNDLKGEALHLCEKIIHIIQKIENQLDVAMLKELDESDRNNIFSSYREVLHQGYKFGFEFQKGVARLITGDGRMKLGKLLISFAHQWMKFVSFKCERGRGHRPRWANQGLEFLIAACDPQYLQSLTDDEFQELKKSMNNCITHLIGSPLSGSRVTSPTHLATQPNFPCYQYPVKTDTQLSSSAISCPENLSRSAEYDIYLQDLSKSNEAIEISGSREWRIKIAINKLEEKLQNKLLSRKSIGRVSDIVHQTPPLHISARRVTFPWQRGFKIGEGRFGKVYTAVNNLTGELIAMKEIRLQPNDHRAIKEAMDEIRTFEGIKHPNIVRYYGVEIHREEMLIFMEYCNEGSLESASQLHLPETLVRKYTRKLLEAVNVLHEHGIVHRDIKSANVFLTSDGNLKLGDFGCCIKLKNHTTMPGELCSFVGTPAYMAPEIFTKNITEGHGRAADIWSVGCVVLEMASGRRPWHDLENSYQIMFRVGMGEIPAIPESLSDEGCDFLNHCLEHDPHQRWTASMLLDHPFTKVIEDDDGI